MGFKSSMMDLGSRGNGSSTNKYMEPIYGLTGLNTLENSAAAYSKVMAQ